MSIIKFKPWAAVTVRDLVSGQDFQHVVPIDDKRDHDFDHECKCDPELQVTEDGAIVFVHTSFDGREYTEALLDLSQVNLN